MKKFIIFLILQAPILPLLPFLPLHAHETQQSGSNLFLELLTNGKIDEHSDAPFVVGKCSMTVKGKNIGAGGNTLYALRLTARVANDKVNEIHAAIDIGTSVSSSEKKINDIHWTILNLRNYEIIDESSRRSRPFIISEREIKYTIDETTTNPEIDKLEISEIHQNGFLSKTKTIKCYDAQD